MKKIVVADDNAVSRGLIKDVLEPESYEIVEAEDGAEALHQIVHFSPDLVLLDIQMPFLDGFEIVRRVRMDPALNHIPIAAVTAFAMKGDCDRAMACGFDAYITKPISAAALRSKVRILLLEGARFRLDRPPVDMI